MGWDAAAVYGCNIDEQMMHRQVDAMVSSGLRDAGYVTFILGCGWQAIDRDKDGVFQVCPSIFSSRAGTAYRSTVALTLLFCDIKVNTGAYPGGMDGMAKYVHDKQMQFGLTSTAGSVLSLPTFLFSRSKRLHESIHLGKLNLKTSFTILARIPAERKGRPNTRCSEQRDMRYKMSTHLLAGALIF